MGKTTDLCELCVFVSAGVCTLYVHLYISLVPFSVESACVFVLLCVNGCTPRTLKGSRRSESTMNPGIPPRLDAERSPVNGERVGGQRE